MKTFRLSVVLFIASLAGMRAQSTLPAVPGKAGPAAAEYQVVERGANHQVWRREAYEPAPDGTLVTHVHQYTELAGGLNYQDATGQWVEAQEVIEAFPGGAIARQGQYQVIFANNLNTAGAIDMQTPDGKRLRSNVLGLMYHDTATGDAVMIAEIQDSTGELISSNQVLYPNAFDGVKADVQYTYKRGGFEQDVILRSKLPTPESFGMDPATTELEVFTEFINPPAANVRDAAVSKEDSESDENINWGAVSLGQGKAFDLGNETSKARVAKRYETIQGRHFLLEKVKMGAIQAAVSKLPEQAVNTRKLPVMAVNDLRFPKTPQARATASPMRLATATLPDKGYVLDYVTVSSSLTNFTFQEDSTYYISGLIALQGTNNFEGGAVLKFTSSSVIYVNSVATILVSKAGSYQMVVFTSKNDDSAGETISGSTGSPTNTGATYLDLLAGTSVKNSTLDGFRFAYAGTAVSESEGSADTSVNSIWNCQFVQCDTAIKYTTYANSISQGLYNVLFANCETAVANDYGYYHGHLAVSGINVTADQVTNLLTTWLGDNYATNNSCFTNSILTAVTRQIYLADNGASRLAKTNACFVSGSSSGIYQTAGNANYYLDANSPCHDAGTTNINFDLLAELQTMTTYAPQDGGWPDTNAPDLGYHYPMNEDSDYDGLPDAWEYYWFGDYTHTAGELDVNGRTLLADYQYGVDPNQIGFTVQLGNQHFNVTNATGGFLVLGGTPAYETVLVNDMNLADAVWTNYDGTVHLNLGPTDGVYQVQIGLKGYAPTATPTWMGTTVYLDRRSPVLGITSPTNATTAVPLLQVQGWSDESLTGVTYGLSNAVAVVTNQAGLLLGGQFFDTNTFEYTTNYFQCYDIVLTNGLNKITLQATDLAGNVTATNLNVTLNYGAATNPALKVYWPTAATAVVGNSFTLRGWVDDATATMVAQVVATNGVTNVVSGLVERDGKFWVENLPLSGGTNWLTLWTTNAAGLMSVTNFPMFKSALNLTVDPVSDDLWLPTVTVTGRFDDFTDYTVWVNGVKAADNGDGTWTAHHVPLPGGGTASIQARAIPNTENGGNGAGGSGGSPVDYDNLGNPDPPTDNDAETNADKPAEVVIDSAHWTVETFDFILDYHQTMIWDYTATHGGTLHDVATGYYPVAGTYTATTDDKYAPNFSFVSGHTSLVYDDPDSGGDDYDVTHGDALVVPLEIGKLSWGGSDGKNIITSKIIMVLHTGGKGLPGLSASKSLFQLSATATEELAYAPFSRGIPPTEITVAGKTLGSDYLAYAAYGDNEPVDVTPRTGAPYYAFTVGAGKHELIHQTLCTAAGNTNNARTTIGIGEQVDIYFNPPLFMTFPEEPLWYVLGEGSIDSDTGSGTTLTAHLSPGSATVKVVVRDETLSMTFSVVAPSGIQVVDQYDVPGDFGISGINNMGAFTTYFIKILPQTVSFAHVNFRENIPLKTFNFPNHSTDTFTNTFVYYSGNGECDPEFEDDIRDPHDGVFSKNVLSNGTSYENYSIPLVWHDEYQNQDGDWIPYVEKHTLTEFNGSTFQMRETYQGRSGSWMGPWQ